MRPLGGSERMPEKPAKRAAHPGLLALLTLLLVGCDHATKQAAVSLLSTRGPLQLLPGVFDLRYTENHDTAFSLTRSLDLADKPLVLGLIASVVLVGALFAWWQQRDAALPVHLGFALMASGAIGNLIDRFARGFVVDFMHLTHWPVFNVADIAVVLGAGLILFGGFRDGRGHRPSAPQPGSS